MADDDKVAALEKRLGELEELSKTRFYLTLTGIVISLVVTCLLWSRFASFAAGTINQFNKSSSSVPADQLDNFVPIQRVN